MAQYFDQGIEFLAKKQYTQAMEFFQAAIEECPDSENAYLRLSETYMAMGRKWDALSVLYKLLSRQPDNAAAQRMVAQWQNSQTVERPTSPSDPVAPKAPKPIPNFPVGGKQDFLVGGVPFTMVHVEAGIFTMGATPEQQKPWEDEKPAHRVTLTHDYYMGETEVTQALWRAVMGCNPSYFRGDDLPVEEVSWDDCQEFIRRLNQTTGKKFRLPTEAEWEYAARGGNRSRGYQYAGSNNPDDVAWYRFNSGRNTHPVKTKRPNELGLYDMSGNVWEWCQDWYGEYSRAPQTNPTGPATASSRVFRGGSWHNGARYCRVAYRNYDAPDCRDGNLGLRLALSE